MSFVPVNEAQLHNQLFFQVSHARNRLPVCLADQPPPIRVQLYSTSAGV